MLPPYNVSPRSSIGEFQSSDSRSLDWNSVRSQHILQQSIHFLMFIWVWVAGQHFKQPRTPAILVRHWGVPKQSQRDNLSSMSWVYPEAYFQLNIPKTPLPRKRLGNTLGIPDRYLNHLNSPSQITKFLVLVKGRNAVRKRIDIPFFNDTIHWPCK